MSNPRITKKERNLLKGAIRRVFSRSEIRKKVIDACIVEHSDPERPRVKKWGLCNVCKKPEAKSYLVVDHLDPVIPLNNSFENMSLDTVVDRMWCEENNLQPLCIKCHDEKSAKERKLRKKVKK